MTMARHFPIFIDLGRSPPLVVGAQPGLAGKLRLLAGFAPRVDLLTGLDAAPAGLARAGVRHIGSMPVAQAAEMFAGRPLIVIDTGDRALDEDLSHKAREIGVPVNVPDKPDLCSFYLGSVVDRDPVILAISTGGYAPVLAQRVRAALEDWLPAGYGRLALYLSRIRYRLRHLSPARRRQLQHRIIDGEASRRIIEGDELRADFHLVEMLARQPERGCGGLHIIKVDTGDPALLDCTDLEAVRNADVILHPSGEAPQLANLARREVELMQADPAAARAYAASMTARGLEVVILKPSAVQTSAAVGRLV